MKSFKFRLASYLKIKEFEEKKAWNDVLKQETLASSLKHKIEVLIAQMEERKMERSQVGSNPGMTQTMAALIGESLAVLEVRLQTMIKEYQKEMALLEKLQDLHNDKKKDAKIIDNFQDRKKKEFKTEVNKLEQKQSNEAAANLFIRRDKKYG